MYRSQLVHGIAPDTALMLEFRISTVSDPACVAAFSAWQAAREDLFEDCEDFEPPGEYYIN